MRQNYKSVIIRFHHFQINYYIIRSILSNRSFIFTMNFKKRDNIEKGFN